MSGADHEHSSAVADEAIRLVSALAGMSPEDRPDRDRTDPDHAEGGAGSPADADPDGRDSGEDGGCTCSTATVQAVCDVCPICRVASFVAEVRPETIERVADLLSMAVGSLEAFAAQRRSEMAGSAHDSEPSTEEAPTAPQAAEWQSVQVEDDLEDEDKDDNK